MLRLQSRRDEFIYVEGLLFFESGEPYVVCSWVVYIQEEVRYGIKREVRSSSMDDRVKMVEGGFS